MSTVRLGLVFVSVLVVALIARAPMFFMNADRIVTTPISSASCA